MALREQLPAPQDLRLDGGYPMVGLVRLAPAFTPSSLTKMVLGVQDTGAGGPTEQDCKEMMLLEWQPGRSPCFFLLREEGGCYSL